jgi:hypothetical protein
MLPGLMLAWVGVLVEAQPVITYTLVFLYK